MTRPYGYPAALTFRAVMNQIATRHAGKSISLFPPVIRSTGLPILPTNTLSVCGYQPCAGTPGPHNIRYGRLWDFPLYLLPVIMMIGVVLPQFYQMFPKGK